MSYSTCTNRRSSSTSRGATCSTDLPTTLFLVVSGRFRAEMSQQAGGAERVLRDYGPCANFGAPELLCHVGARRCSVRALEDGCVWGIPRRIVEQKLKIAPPLADRTLVDFCTSVALFSSVAANRDQLLQLCRGVARVEFGPHDQVVAEGQAAEALYVVHSGNVYTVASGDSGGFSVTLEPRRAFGESALGAPVQVQQRGDELPAAPPPAPCYVRTVCAGSDGAVLLRWSAAAVETLVGFELQEVSRKTMNRKVLETARCARRRLADGLTLESLDALLSHTAEETFTGHGSLVVAQGDADHKLYVIKSGGLGPI